MRPPATVFFEHYCEEPGCNVWGMLGYEPVKGQQSFWCWPHFPDEEWKAERRKYMDALNARQAV
ncbi:hypothetical protein G6L08_03480 [Agrobacterium rhizogenes]|nr:hypothetical protein [Rhizobium rhizogenes]